MSPEEEIKSLKKKLKEANIVLVLWLTALVLISASKVMSHYSAKDLNKAIYKCGDKCVKKVGFNSYECIDCVETVR